MASPLIHGLIDGDQAVDETHSWTPTIPAAAMGRLMAHFNGVMRATCARVGCAVATQVLERDWGDGDFVDSGHFSRAGGREFAEFMARRIQVPVPR